LQNTEITSHYWGLGGLTHCGMDVGMIEGHAFTNNWDNINCAECLVYKPGPRFGTPTLQNFYVTFGVKYRHEKHEHWPDAHPDGWLLVQAEDEPAAWALVRKYIDNVYAFTYSEDRFERKWHPLGELARITPEGATSSREGIGAPTLLAEPTTRKVRVSWYETTHYSYDIEVPLDFDVEADDADEILEQRICELDTADLDGAYTGTTERQITEKQA